MKIKPLFDRVVLKQMKEEIRETTSGLVLPESAQERPLVAEVIAVGNGYVDEETQNKMQVKVGDKVVYSKYAGTLFKLNNKDVVLIRQNDILAIIED